jgi:hypothetical protein
LERLQITVERDMRTETAGTLYMLLAAAETAYGIHGHGVLRL